MTSTYVIHMDSSTTRMPLIEALRGTLPDVRILPATDGRAMTPGERSAVTEDALLSPVYPFGLMPSEIGCFLSHRSAWMRIADGDAPFGLVAEDDLALEPGFDAALALALKHGNEDSLIRFPMRDREEPAPQPGAVIEETAGLRLFRPKVIGLTATLYLLGRSAARRLLQRSERFDRPVDTWLQMRWETGVDSLTLWPAHIVSAAPATGGSTIQAKRGIGGEISRTWRRNRYRSAIAKLSAKA